MVLKLGFLLLFVGVMILVFLGKKLSSIHEEPGAAKRDRNKHNGRLLMAVAFLSLVVGLGLVVWGLTRG